MNLRTELQQLVISAIADTNVDAVYKRIVRDMKIKARKGKRSCNLDHIRWLSIEQTEAVKQRLRDEKIVVIEHYGLRPLIELGW